MSKEGLGRGRGRGRGRTIGTSQIRTEIVPMNTMKDDVKKEKKVRFAEVDNVKIFQEELAAEELKDQLDETGEFEHLEKKFEAEELKPVDEGEKAGPSRACVGILKHEFTAWALGRQSDQVKSGTEMEPELHQLPPPETQKKEDEVPPTLEVTGQKWTNVSRMKQFVEMRKVRAVRVNTPQEFYLVLDEDVSSSEIENIKLLEIFQLEMTKAKWDSIEYTRVIRAEPEAFYAYYDCRRKQWLRVKLLRIFPHATLQIGLAFCIDLKLEQYVSLTALRSLPEKFARTTVPIYRCSLYDIYPNTPKKTQPRWSEDAVQFFKDFLEPGDGKSLYAFPIKWKESEQGEETRNRLIDVQVVLYSSGKNNKLRSINWKMVNNGYAYSKINK